MQLGWNTYILVLCGMDARWDTSLNLFAVLPRVFLPSQMVPACNWVIVVFLVTFRAVAAYFFALI